ncbi:MAG: hypothetical protein ACREDR_16315, partial [Blastocatellia bacterium]
MDNLDRLGWVAGFSFVSYGVHVGVRVTDCSVIPRLIEFLPPGSVVSEQPSDINRSDPGLDAIPKVGVDRLYSLIVAGTKIGSRHRRVNLSFADLTMIGKTADLDETFDLFESDLQLHVAEAARGRVFVHSGVVAWNGKAILVPGRSFSGKTTLVKELVRAGATYYSDEYAVLDRRGRVYPYPKPLAIRNSGSQIQTKVTVESLGGSRGDGPVPVGLVAVCTYKEGAKWRPRSLSAGQGALALLANT